ncbi:MULTISPECIES: acyl-CoA dehydrogenase [Rhodococcus]|uniref:Broad-specificity linear acyl-CoA dehydrogenase FadE5 n=1 Tax=Rhodococcus oxybenzonivorans TaxID=1990687 RepID=A0AAE4V5S7_9NOCA|nr:MULTISPECIES: acyl-CoA dehydrogenase [Rhodococcus]MDV7245371.1 acyl-CoA dehydrogenase [Rhodococcus oxybenzonivorans]MDV7268471.1 acyl-CoA dehydrogenase [Rhodococcus oxybenzonivorans]MDV7272349.1 acyl-CoA dehydrogenase [Rhodococcus oxybenzonivorans]MDV7336396.1 acyl-CoA dehydrogenase [Rhodococcus oxybenzonivorans]MDV7347696.1 acyl-CoA dehydrogenase [Rhodococcus oxybenzonivorans]
MGHYKSNVRDLEFNLFEALRLGDILDTDAYGDLDSDVVRTMLAELRHIAEGPVAESFAEIDRNPPTFDPSTHTVHLPEGLKAAYRAGYGAGWDKVGIAEELGGTPMPRPVVWALIEMLIGANPAAHMYAMGACFGDVFFRHATEEQKRWAQIWVERDWGSSMVLTEPDAGSDVGAGRTKAIAQPDGSWQIEGVKRFITSGESGDLFDNIVHLVLARPEGAGPGTKGLSLFAVPKFLFDFETGELGERNGVYATGLEHKMGLKGSATCELTFGGHDRPAKGWLVGERHDGIAQMFDIIEIARMMVGTKAISTLSTGYLNALDYAKQRVQGADMTQLADKTAPRVPIIRHPDVRHSLMMQKAYAEGLRAVYMYTAAHHDAVVAQHVSGADPGLASRVNDLLLPIVKGVGSERAYQYLTESLQTLGGSGYLQDYPLEQYIRDAKIDSLYEGTTAIQAQDFFFRKIARDRGEALSHVVGQIREFLTAQDGSERLKNERQLLETALGDIEMMTAALTTHLLAAGEEPTELYKVGLGSVRYLLAVGDLLVGWQLLSQAQIALAKLDAEVTGTDGDFYRGKVAVAQYFTRTILPGLAATRVVLGDLDGEIMDIEDAVF